MSASVFRRVPRFEALESRRVLAASGVSVTDGILTIDGTNKNDKIVVELTELGDQLSVQVNKTTTLVPLVATQGQESTPLTEIHINALNGNDRVWVGAGVLLNVVIDGGKGNDWLWGGGGNDTISAGQGNDHSYGGAGDDTIDCGQGNDHAFGQDGADKLYGYDGHDRLHGGLGDDEAWGGNGFDHLRGDAGADTLHGEDGKDLIYGGDDNDWLDGGDGKDKLWGEVGDDNIKGGLGNDHLNGGEGVNLLDGDEGVNKLWNGTEYDFENPPTPPAATQYVTVLTDGTRTATIVYKKVALGGGFEETLDFTVDGAGSGEDLGPVIVGGFPLTFSLIADAAGHAHILFSSASSVPETTLPPDLVLVLDPNVANVDVFIGLTLSGYLNLSTPS